MNTDMDSINGNQEDFYPEEINAVILHTENQPTASAQHAQTLHGRRKNSTLIQCDDFAWFQEANIHSFDEVHLIVDTSMFTNIMKDGQLDRRVKKKFRDIERSRKRIYLVNNFSEDLDELFFQLPRSTRRKWEDQNDIAVTAMSGGVASESIVLGTNNGQVFYGNITVLQTEQEMKILSGAKQGQPGDLTVNYLKMAIKHDRDENENDRMLTEVSENNGKFLNNQVLSANVEEGSVIITLTVEKTLIMTDEWINDQLKIIFNEILASFVADGTKFCVTVKRYVTLSREEMLKLYIGQGKKQTKVLKSDDYSEKGKQFTENRSTQTENIDSFSRKLQPSTDSSTQTENNDSISRKPPSTDLSTLMENFDGSEAEKLIWKANSIAGKIALMPQVTKCEMTVMEPLKFLHFLNKYIFQGRPPRMRPLMISFYPEKPMSSIDHGVTEKLRPKKKRGKSNKIESIESVPIVQTRTLSTSRISYKRLTTPPDYVPYSPLYAAALRGDENTAKELIDMKVDINVQAEDGSTPLFAAARRGHAGFIKLLLKNGADVNRRNKKGETVLILAAKHGHVLDGQKDIIEILLRSGADVHQRNMEGNTPLHVATQNGHKDTVEILLRSGAYINQGNMQGKTPLHVAAENGDKVIVDLLLKLGAYINHRNMEGNMPIYVAAKYGHKETVEILVKSGADVNQGNKEGNTPLHVAAKNGHEDVVMILLKSGADVNCRNLDGITPLCAAAKYGHRGVVEMMVLSGTTLTRGDSKGNSPLDIAKKKEKNAVFSLMPKMRGVSKETGYTRLHQHQLDAPMPMIHCV